MLNNRTTEKQFSYIKRLYEQLNSKNIVLDSKPDLRAAQNLSEENASRLIKDLRKKLNIPNVKVINQFNPLKTISNIMIKKEWIEEWKYKENSILAWIPDYQNNRYLEISFPKGGRIVENENKNGEWITKEIGSLIYEQKPVNFYHAKIDLSNWISCGVRLDWSKKIRWISMDTKEPVHEKENLKYENFVDLFESIILEFKNSKLQQEEKILKSKLEAKKRKEKLDQDNALNSQIFNNFKKENNKTIEHNKIDEIININIWDPPDEI
ncbi:hypothetical protein [Spiroplasma endosymbiont of Diplazon laetatorius]|uniref:hypothetical protein n=1 Tax=Spiroplasma endosymbiont of Diplazon laetatorius TaxID=3066322 RepID=UPI0030D21CDF